MEFKRNYTTWLQGCCTFFYISFLSHLGERLSVRLRTALFHSLLQNSIYFFDSHRTGELVNRLENQLHRVNLSASPTCGCVIFLINPWHACAARVTVVGSVCFVCLSVLQLTSQLFVRPANDTIYYNQFNRAVFFLNMFCCRDLSSASIVRIQTVGHIPKTRMRIISTTCVGSHLFSLWGGERDGLKLREFWLSCLRRARFAHNVKLVYIPLKLKVCKSCQHVL